VIRALPGVGEEMGILIKETAKSTETGRLVWKEGQEMERKAWIR
jgi:hypothetical protein